MTAPLQRIPLRLIAEQAKVSRMTVSLALRDHPSLPAATRRRIKALAGMLGYRPDPDIANLMRKIGEKRQREQSSTIAYLTSNQFRGEWQTLVTQRLYFEGAQRRARENGYALEEFWLGETGMTDVRLSEILRNRGIEGVVIAPVPAAENLPLQNFKWNYFSAVALGYSLARPALHRACSHQYQAMLLLIRQMGELGYRRFGLAMVLNQDERVNYNWRAAFFAGTSVWPQEAEVPLFLTPDWCFEKFSQWIEKYRPDVVIPHHEVVLEWLQKLGRRVPEEIGVAFPNLDFSGSAGRSGCNQNSELVGASAIDLLISLMRRNQRGIPKVATCLMSEASFVRGATIRSVGAKSLGKPRIYTGRNSLLRSGPALVG